jgi:hypothetical protein
VIIDCDSSDCKEFFAESLFVVGEFGGNDYNALLFAGKDLKEAYKLMPHVIQGISDAVEVNITVLSLLLFSVLFLPFLFSKNKKKCLQFVMNQ